MHPLLYRAPVLRGRSLALRNLPRFQFIARRNEATAVTGRPASQTIEQAALNLKEEVGNSARDIAKSIAGSPVTSQTTALAGKDESFVSPQTTCIHSHIVINEPSNQGHHYLLNRLRRPKTISTGRPGRYVNAIFFQICLQ